MYIRTYVYIQIFIWTYTQALNCGMSTVQVALWNGLLCCTREAQEGRGRKIICYCWRIFTCVHRCIGHIHIYMHTFICMYIYIYLYMCVYIYSYVCRHIYYMFYRVAKTHRMPCVHMSCLYVIFISLYVIFLTRAL